MECKRILKEFLVGSTRQKPPDPANQTRFVLARKLVLPNPQHAPPCPAQHSRYENVARPVAGEFLFPERAIAFWLCSVFGTAMPETAVNEHRELEFWKNEIRFAEDLLIPPPTGDFVSPEKFDEGQLGFFVSARANARHQFAARQSCKQLAHDTKK
jgi:hypothetical protein